MVILYIHDEDLIHESSLHCYYILVIVRHLILVMPYISGCNWRRPLCLRPSSSLLRLRKQLLPFIFPFFLPTSTSKHHRQYHQFHQILDCVLLH